MRSVWPLYNYDWILFGIDSKLVGWWLKFAETCFGVVWNLVENFITSLELCLVGICVKSDSSQPDLFRGPN